MEAKKRTVYYTLILRCNCPLEWQLLKVDRQFYRRQLQAGNVCWVKNQTDDIFRAKTFVLSDYSELMAESKEEWLRLSLIAYWKDEE